MTSSDPRPIDWFSLSVILGERDLSINRPGMTCCRQGSLKRGRVTAPLLVRPMEPTRRRTAMHNSRRPWFDDLHRMHSLQRGVWTPAGPLVSLQQIALPFHAGRAAAVI